MSQTTPQDQIDAAAAYEDLHVAALFREWAPRVADAAGIRGGHCVLDIACGTGVLAREAHLRVGSGHVAGVDANRGMLAIAERLAPAVDWKEGSAESLPFTDESFDAVVSQFGLMFFADRDGAIREMLRVLNRGGRLAVAVWDALENSPVYPAWVALLERTAGASAADALCAPFVLGDRDALRRLFENAGVQSVSINTLRGTARFPSIRAMAEADLRGWLPMMGITLQEDKIRSILQEAEREFADYVTGEGEFVFDSPAHIVTASRRASAKK